MDVLDGSRREVDRSTHGDDLAALAAVAHLHPDPATFEPWLRSTLTRRDTDATGIQLATVHRVKGREWNNVLVFDASEGLMPHRLSSDRAEERRVFHVAITRARQQVAVLAGSENPSRFVAELDAPGTPEVIAPKPATPSVDAGTSRTTSNPALAAEVGTEVAIPGGLEGSIVEITATGVVVSAGRARTNVAFGTAVKVRGKMHTLAPPRDERTARILSALKEWRRSTAAQGKVPAYTVLHDAHLEEIAAAKPDSLRALGQCKGVGPTKLERWGDEILTVIEEAGGAAESPPH
jgi:DNA helicase II / ATP-dependent DNA helicase PcrA